MSNKHPLLKFEIGDDVRRQIESHCFSATDHEVGGFLVGSVSDGVTKIEGMIASTKAKSDQANLTFTHEAWDEAYAVLHEQFSEFSLVGWYHSHPGYGVFLSDYDAFIQHNFFADPSHVALVIDPLAAEVGWFVSRDGDIKTVLTEDTQREALKPANRDDAGKPTVVAAHRPDHRVATLVASVALTGVVFGALGFWLGSKQPIADATSAGPSMIVFPEYYRVELDRPALEFLKADPDAFAVNALGDLLTLLGSTPEQAPEMLRAVNPELGKVSYVLLPLNPYTKVARTTEDLHKPIAVTETASATPAVESPTTTPTATANASAAPSKGPLDTSLDPNATP